MYVPCKSMSVVILSFKTEITKPDIVNYIYEHPKDLDLKMKGFWISDRKHCPFANDISPANSLISPD